MQLGDISVRFVDLMLGTVRALHPAPMEVLRRFNVTPEQLSTPDARISISKYMMIGHAFIKETGRGDLGLMMGRNLQITHFGLPGYAVMTAPRLETALGLCIQFEKLASENRRGSSRFVREAEGGVAEFYSISPYNDYNRFVVDSILGGWLTLSRWLCAEDRLLERVEIEFEEPEHQPLYKAIFGCPVRFRQSRNALVFKPAALALPVVYAQAAAHQASLALCNEALLAIRHSLPLEDKVRQIILAQPQLATTQIDRVAAQLGLTAWTLRRQLALRGFSVSGLADEARRDMAESYLTDTSMLPSEIAFELGYRSQPSFFRAFRRWFGMTPEDYRRGRGETWKVENAVVQSSTASSAPSSSSKSS